MRTLAFALALLVSSAVRVHAQDEAAAREAFEQATAAVRAGEPARALELFRASLEAADRPATRFNIAFLLAEVGQRARAARELRALLEVHADDVAPALAESARTLMEQLVPQIAKVNLQVVPADARITADGREVRRFDAEHPLLLDPGEHVIEARAPGFTTSREEVTLQAGETLSVRVTLARAFGTLVVRSHPEARVTVEGVAKGQGELRVQVPVGEHITRAVLGDADPVERQVQVDAGELLEVDLSLRAERHPWKWAVGIGGAAVAVGVAVALLFVYSSWGQDSGEPNPSGAIIYELR